MNTSTAISFINRNSRFILTGHETPDADAIGAECALYHALIQLGKQVRIINADPIPRLFTFLDNDNIVEVLDDATNLSDLDQWCLVVLDSNDINNIGAVRDRILANVSEYLIIDHHDGDHSLAEGNVIVAGASSTCEILNQIIEDLDVSLTLPMAVAIFSGIVYDTGSFIFPKTSANTFRIAEKLVTAGVQPNFVYTKMYESNTTSSLRLQSIVFSSLTLHHGDQVAVQKMMKEDLVKTGAPYEEGQTLINNPLKSEQIKVSVFFKENEAGILRCSLRSKGNIDVAELATGYGGGGHKNAAGFKSQLPLEAIQKKVLEQLASHFA